MSKNIKLIDLSSRQKSLRKILFPAIRDSLLPEAALLGVFLYTELICTPLYFYLSILLFC